MRSPARRCFTLAIVLMLAIGHAAGLQLIAWTSMFIDRVQTGTVTEAITSTFDGSRPCAICHAAKEFAAAEAAVLPGKGAGKAPTKQVASPHLAWVDREPLMMPAIDASVSRRAWPDDGTKILGLVSEPPTPPPRA